MDPIKEQLISEVFELAQEKSASKTKNGLCYHITLTLEKEINLGPDPSRSFKRCYERFIEKNQKAYSPNRYTLNLLSNYIGFKDYQDFVARHYHPTSPKPLQKEREAERTAIANPILNYGIFIAENYGQIHNYFSDPSNEKAS